MLIAPILHFRDVQESFERLLIFAILLQSLYVHSDLARFQPSEV